MTVPFERVILGGRNRRMAVSLDGQRFLLLTVNAGDTATEDAPPPEIHVVLNWFEELQARVPTGR